MQPLMKILQRRMQQYADLRQTLQIHAALAALDFSVIRIGHIQLLRDTTLCQLCLLSCFLNMPANDFIRYGHTPTSASKKC